MESRGELIHLSMQPHIDRTFGDGFRLSTDETLRAFFRQPANRFSYDHSTIAELEDETAGLLVSYPAHRLMPLNLAVGRLLLRLHGLKDFLRLARRLIYMSTVREAMQDEYYISNLAVLSRIQRHGIGASLLDQAEKLAKREGLRKCSLMVDSRNTAAGSLYEKTGFRVVASGTIRYPGRSTPESGYHRMVKTLTR